MDLNILIRDMSGYLNKSFWGISLSDVLLAAVVILLSIMIAALVRPILRRISRRHAPDPKSRTGQVIDALTPPVRMTPILFGVYFAAHILHLSGTASAVADQLLKSLLIAAIFWALIRLVTCLEPMLNRLNLNLESSAQEWLKIGMQLLVLSCGVAIILEIWGIPIAPLIGGLGVFGIAVGLAAKDLIGNLISGLLIMSEKRMQPGEWIKVDGVIEGTVEKISFRSTRIRRFDLSPAYVPNSALADNAVTNFSRMTYRRINWMVGLEYSTPPESLEKIRDEVEQWLLNDRRICHPPKASLFVRIDSFGENSINLMIYCFTTTTVWAEWLAIKEDFALAMMPIVKNNKSGFAFPSRSVYLQQIDPPEIINPAQIEPK